MASLGTLALGTFTNVSNTAITGTDPVLEVIGSTDDADFVRDTSNSDHTGDCWFAVATTLPADLGNVDTLSINLRYGLDTTKGTNDWLFLQARVFKSDGTTALTNLLTVVDGGTGITATTPTNSGAVAFVGVDTAATKAEWQAAQVHIYFVINRDGGGDAVVERVYAAELTGTYTADTADELLANDLTSGTPTLGTPVITQVHALNAGDLSSGTPTLTSALIGQKHVITADDLVAGTPTLTSPALAVIHNLLADSISVGAPTLSSPVLTEIASDAVEVIDVFSDERPQRQFKQRQEKLREDLQNAYNRAFGIAVDEETTAHEMVAAIEENLPQIRKLDYLEVERRALEKLLAQYHSIARQTEERQRLEDEWDTDAIMAIAQIIQ